MVLDINYFRDENLLKQLKESEERRCESNSVVDKVIEADKDWKKAMFAYDQLKKSVNEVSKKISEYTKLNRHKGDLSNDSEFLGLKNLAESKKQGIAECLKNIEECNDKRNSLLKMVGNVVSPDVIASKDEALNEVIRSWVPNLFPWESKPDRNTTDTNFTNNQNSLQFNGKNSLKTQNSGFNTEDSGTATENSGVSYVGKLPEIKRPPWKILQHHEILAKLNSLEINKAVEIAGHRAFFLKGKGCLLNMALIQYGLQFLVRKGYLPVHTPYFMRKEVMSECAELDDFETTLYCIPLTDSTAPNATADATKTTSTNGTRDMELKEKDVDKNKLFLIATSEQPIAALHRNEVYQKKQLPIRYAGISTCFRREAGAHGKDLRGIFRVHQFQKVEQFVVCTPENSIQEHEQMVKFSEEFYRSLKLPYRIVSIVAGALNKAASKKYDLEAWFPGYEDYRELVSCSNCTDYQAQNLNSKFYDKNNQDRKHVHMLNGTLVASQRCLCCILENYQTPDGIIVPEPLVPYMDGLEFIPFEN
ncbi:seryl-tRNA synthetase, putative [Theileria annulata]|uniref:serine--tRNA ligase n=1 Tax=Theileria annulata TaxID=5874 RepID=Q4UCK4_THEAN|nr:seryl-tRNA synthetase, putative [Theileria annulata]CAI75447.1 seryl-tRNA synthetase, putative [Theileria annulata]|eukprot:XP_954923.1 seryl-tRNA synthetase, putative [Theileria annulata]